MVEIFNYTERVVNMTRPRKVLMMAIGEYYSHASRQPSLLPDGVAPRAKMNQQRSRRFRAAQEAADKEEERKEAIKMYEAMGHTVSDETRNKRSWDSNAITPGQSIVRLRPPVLNPQAHRSWTFCPIPSNTGSATNSARIPDGRTSRL